MPSTSIPPASDRIVQPSDVAPTPVPPREGDELRCPACVRIPHGVCPTCNSTRYVTRAAFTAWYEIKAGRPTLPPTEK